MLSMHELILSILEAMLSVSSLFAYLIGVVVVDLACRSTFGLLPSFGNGDFPLTMIRPGHATMLPPKAKDHGGRPSGIARDLISRKKRCQKNNTQH